MVVSMLASGCHFENRMKKTTILTIAALFVAFCLPVSAADKAADDFAKLKTETTETIEQFKKVDPTMKKFFEKSVGYVVFPSITKGGLGVGGAHGKGLAFESGKITGNASVSQITIGWQVGGQVLREIVSSETQGALARLKASLVAPSAKASAVAATPR